MTLFLIVLSTIFFLFCHFLFSGSEMSIISCERMRMQILAKKGNRGARLVLYFLDHPNILFSITLVGVNLSMVANSTILTSYLGYLLRDYEVRRILGTEPQSLLALIILWPLVLVFSEVIPMGTFRHFADALAPLMARFLQVAYYLLYPFTKLSSLIISSVYKVLKIEKKDRRLQISREELRTLLARDKSVLSREEKNMIEHLFHFEKITVEDAMVPLINVTMISSDKSIRDIFKIVDKYGFSRVPIYDGRVDNVVGLVKVTNLLEVEENTPVMKYREKCFFVPETARAQHVLSEMRNNNVQMAIVVDEFGGVQGIVTVEDILEEILGEIEDEYDQPERGVRIINENQIIVDGNTELKTLCEEYELDIQAEDVETIAGFLLSLLGYIPQKGMVLKYKNYLFTVLECTDRKIKQVEIRTIND